MIGRKFHQIIPRMKANLNILEPLAVIWSLRNMKEFRMDLFKIIL